MDIQAIDKTFVIGALKEKVCKIVFTKKNGETRIMHATLNETMLPPQKDIEEEIQKKSKKLNEEVLAVYDVNAPGWRSFRWDSVTDFNAEFNG